MWRDVFVYDTCQKGTILSIKKYSLIVESTICLFVVVQLKQASSYPQKHVYFIVATHEPLLVTHLRQFFILTISHQGQPPVVRSTLLH